MTELSAKRPNRLLTLDQEIEGSNPSSPANPPFISLHRDTSRGSVRGTVDRPVVVTVVVR